MSLPSTDTPIVLVRTGLAGAGVLAATALGDFALACACFAAVAAISVRRERTWRRAASRDPLTGVGNYRRLHERLHEAVAADAQRFALLTLDVDCFKAINERHGHLQGDRLLQEVSQALNDSVRGQDMVARQGGDEFSVLAPQTDEAGAALLAQRIEQALQRIEAIDREPVRASIGIALFPQHGRTPGDLLEKADAELRATKQRRRVDQLVA
jgi:diguanylate cyclase (GGDEF)-like protein